jgi:site-specific recombinase XerD
MQTIQQQLTRMKTDMQMRGLSEHTQDAYLRYARRFLGHCGKQADELDESDARAYLIFLMHEGNLDPSSINLHNAAIRFFFAVTLNRTLNYLQLPRFKKRKALPEILTREETQRLIDECVNTKHKSFFLLAYGGGLRVSEIAALRIKDIDSKSMRIFVRRGKGHKDRYTLYSDDNKQKILRITAEEFIRRFLSHVLPVGFRKIRHFGLFASRDKTKRLILCKLLTRTFFTLPKESTMERLVRIFGENFNLCPCCKSEHLSRASPSF